MPRKRNNSAAVLSEIVTVITSSAISEPLPINDLEDETIEDYKKLGDKQDTVMTKIKVRKERKK